MSAMFDPHHRWLGIAPEEQPADHYRLLGLKQFEDDADVIESAADRQMAHVRGFQSGEHGGDAQRLLNEISAAKLVLLKSAEKTAYDAQLQARLELAQRKERQERPIATAQPIGASAPPPAAPPPRSSAASPAGPVIQTRGPRKSGGPNIVLLGGIAAAVLLLLIGGVIAVVVGPWASDGFVANNNRNNYDGDAPPAIVTPPPPPPPVSTDDDEEPAPPAPPIDTTPTNNTIPEDEDDPPVIPVEPIDNGEQVALVPPVAPPGPTKSPVPDKAARDAAREKIDGIFPLDDAKNAEEKLKLAQQLLATARETKNDPVAQFVLLNMARETAADIAQARLAFEAIDLLEADFDFDTQPVRLATLGAAVKSQVPAAEKREVLIVGAEMVDAMIERDQYEAAATLLNPLLDLARRSRDDEALDALIARRKHAAELHEAYQEAQTAIETLKTDPDDADANLTAGKFYLLAKGDWQRALPLLVKGRDERLAQVAVGEVGNPREAKSEKALADAWWTSAENESDASARRFYRARAGFWYREAADQLVGIGKVQAEQRIKDTREAIREMLPSAVDFLDEMQESATNTGGNMVKRPNRKFAGEVPKHGLFMHAAFGKGTVFATYQLDGQYDTFEAIAGVFQNTQDPRSPLVFSVVGDDTLLWASRGIQRQGDGQPCKVDVAGIDTLTIRVTTGGDNTSGHSGWIYPRLTRNNGSRSLLSGDLGIRSRHDLRAAATSEPEHGVFSSIPSEHQPKGPREDGLIAHWTFDEGRGEVTRDLAGGHHGAIEGATWIDGVRGGALAFDGVDDVVEIPLADALNIRGQITLAAWVRAKSLRTKRGDQNSFTSILSQGDKDGTTFLRYIDRGEGPSYSSGAYQPGKPTQQAMLAVPSADVGQWVHVAGVYDGGAWRLYRSGRLVASENSDLGAQGREMGWLIGGADDENQPLFFHGDIDDVRIYNRALSAEEIAALADAE